MTSHGSNISASHSEVVLKEEYNIKPYTYPYLWDGSYKTSLEYFKGFPEAKAFNEIINQRYRLKLKLSKFRGNFYLNNEGIVYRKGKFKPVGFNRCKLLEGTPTAVGGSNSHPWPHFKEGYCIVEIELDSFPSFSAYTYHCHVEVLEFSKIAKL